MDIRLKTADFELDGKSYKICCNMNVLSDVQEAFGGDITPALEISAGNIRHWLAAMLNDCNDERGVAERFTARDIGRKLTLANMDGAKKTVMELVRSALSSGEQVETEDSGEESKNAETTQGE